MQRVADVISAPIGIEMDEVATTTRTLVPLSGLWFAERTVLGRASIDRAQRFWCYADRLWCLPDAVLH